MAIITKIKDAQLVGGSSYTEIYPVTSTQAVFNSNNVSQESINTSTNNRITVLEGKTKLSNFTDDLGNSPIHTHSQYLTEHQSLANYSTTSQMNSAIAAYHDNSKINEPASEGTNGQVLTTNGNGGRIWQSISSGTTNFDLLSNRPLYNGIAMTHSTNIPEVKSTIWDAKQNAIDIDNKVSSDFIDDINHTNKFVTALEKQTWNSKSTVNASSSGTSTTEVRYLTIDDIEWKIKSGAGVEVSTTEPTDPDVTVWVNPNGTQGKTSQLINDSGFLTEHQSLSEYRKSTAQDEIDDAIKGRVTTIENKESEWDSKYSKPASGIPYSDLSSGVKTSLDKADSALQEHQSLAAYSTTTQMNTAIANHHDSTKVNVSDLSEYTANEIETLWNSL